MCIGDRPQVDGVSAQSVNLRVPSRLTAERKLRAVATWRVTAVPRDLRAARLHVPDDKRRNNGKLFTDFVATSHPAERA